MSKAKQEGLTTREMELMQVIWQKGEVTVDVLQSNLPDRLEGSTIRTLLQIMENKGYVLCSRDGRANVYRPAIEQETVQKSAMKKMIQKLFGGSAEMLLARLVEEEQMDLEEVARLQQKLKAHKENMQ